MLFCNPSEVNEVWAVVARATCNNELGTVAKVAPDNGEPGKVRLICIYTKDFNDLGDVERVVRKMRNLGLVTTSGKPIYYKPNAYTYLELNSDNRWSIKTSLYSSADVLKPKDGKVDNFFSKEKRNPGNWR